MLKDIIIDWKVTLINLAGRYSDGLIVEMEGARANSNTKYQSAQKYKPIFSVLILAFMHFRTFVLIYLYEL